MNKETFSKEINIPFEYIWGENSWNDIFFN